MVIFIILMELVEYIRMFQFFINIQKDEEKMDYI